MTSAVRLAKPTSNLFRARTKRDGRGLDTSGLTGVLGIDAAAHTAEVAGMCTYEHLVAATLRYGLSPLVVPQLKTITVGGAVSGLGIVPQWSATRVGAGDGYPYRRWRIGHRIT
ncbi:hypothetical protein NJB14197_41420 [Mycobacterium montefiorense]|uniref:FAD linked oxidase N-terminal domain-containing protein n=1 Tax=Mycobacterium montefiorense TaxID=154654 RepID=A0AA37PM14_9MYCO|nr:hypothetical protein MmonteBS_02980 [Mycobacterium montefiorense]GKU35430.1 hypothetical protein NJB14191_27760 [Mycobacterium montefiorense]GKU40431.1 hypothetical protein NJB14192_24180 [Mycobacterium montefiorense]GKU45809.1 hypothetical protein NJB14194_24300 [Mycobacterium montefiorense]GKU50165.1 hypothetical protein NJB14195_14110 [Mycobacterium montefiorense]